jgi:hypothetical protein
MVHNLERRDYIVRFLHANRYSHCFQTSPQMEQNITKHSTIPLDQQACAISFSSSQILENRYYIT